MGTIVLEFTVHLTLKAPNKNCSRQHFTFLLSSIISNIQMGMDLRVYQACMVRSCFLLLRILLMHFKLVMLNVILINYGMQCCVFRRCECLYHV